MAADHIYLLFVLAGALALFASGRVRPDLVAGMVLVSLMLPWRPKEGGGLAGILDPREAISGFGSPALIMVASMFVLSAAMVRTGAAELMGRRLLAFGARSERSLQLTVLGVVTLFSSVVNDTTTVLLWMPLVLQVCRERGYAPSRVLLLLAYASLLGGQWTLIGTRSNILISDHLRAMTGEGLGFFEFTPVAALVWAGALAGFLASGHRLLPARASDPGLAERYEVTEYLTEILVTPSADVAGRTLEALDLAGRHEVTVVEVIRGESRLPASANLVVFPGDVFVVQGVISKIAEVSHRPGFEFRAELKLGDKTLRSVDLRMVEALVAPESPLIGRSLAEMEFADHYGLSVLAVGRGGRPLTGRPLSQRLHFGDSLLLVGHEAEIERLRRDPALLLLESRSLPVADRRKAVLVTALLGAAIAASATRLLDVTFALPAAALAAVLTRCIGARAAYGGINLPAIMTVGGMIPFGLALEKTGAAEAVAHSVAGSLSGFGPGATFAFLLLAATLLTQVVENAAAAIVLAPVAYELAVAAGASPRPFLLGLAICVSSAFCTPVAHESTILVLGPGGYTFRDYLRAGVPLALLTWIVASLLVPMLCPF